MAYEGTQKDNWMKEARTAAQMLIDARAAATEAVQKYTSLGYSTGLVDGDLTGTEFEGLEAADFVNAVTQFNSYETWIDAGVDDVLQVILK